MALLSSLKGLGCFINRFSPALKHWANFKRRRRQNRYVGGAVLLEHSDLALHTAKRLQKKDSQFRASADKYQPTRRTNMNTHLDSIDRQIAAKHLLTHPFYLAWTRGELSMAALADYARQYYHHVAAFPTYLSAVHARCDDQPTRKQLLDNLVDEEAGSPNHPELWLQFAEGLGVSKEDVQDLGKVE